MFFLQPLLLFSLLLHPSQRLNLLLPTVSLLVVTVRLVVVGALADKDVVVVDLPPLAVRPARLLMWFIIAVGIPITRPTIVGPLMTLFNPPQKP